MYTVKSLNNGTLWALNLSAVCRCPLWMFYCINCTFMNLRYFTRWHWVANCPLYHFYLGHCLHTRVKKKKLNAQTSYCSKEGSSNDVKLKPITLFLVWPQCTCLPSRPFFPYFKNNFFFLSWSWISRRTINTLYLTYPSSHLTCVTVSFLYW